MLLHLDPLRAILTRDRLLVLVPRGADSILRRVEERVRKGDDDTEVVLSGMPDSGGIRHAASRSNLHQDEEDDNNDNCSNDECREEWKELEAKEWIRLPFELQCAEAILHVVATILTDETNELQDAAQKHLKGIVDMKNFSASGDPLTVLRLVKDAVNSMMNRVTGFTESLNRVLDDDEDMALMNLSRLVTHPDRFIQPVSQTILDEESDEPELILESNLQIALTLINSLELLQGQIHTAKELVDQQQDATRNQLLLANMVISVCSLCVALASMVGSLFGMNLPNPYEEQQGSSFQTFRQVSYGTVGGAIAVCGTVIAVLWYTGTIPRTPKAHPVHL